MFALAEDDAGRTELGPADAMRQEAAELAVAIGREIQALNAEGNYFSNGHDKSAYEAVLCGRPNYRTRLPLSVSNSLNGAM